jgi:hypothetical protein
VQLCRYATALLLMLIVATSAFARVGGGESFGGGSSGDGDGGGEIIAELVFYLLRFLFWLTVHHPAIGIPVDIAVVVAFIWWRRNNGKMPATIFRATTTPPVPQRRVSMDALRRFDPNFSESVFRDFCYSLYGFAHLARGAKDLDRYALYLSQNARQALYGRNPQKLKGVRNVIVGAFRIEEVRGLDGPTVVVSVAYESNYTDVTADAETSWYVRERWMLERRRDILSPPPEKAKADHCPRCGAALQTRTDGACDYCGVKIETGEFHWFVRAITLVSREDRGPALTSDVPEQGTHFPTIRDAHVDVPPGFEERVRFIASELQAAWSARDWERVRPLETEPLFQMHRYWIDAYRAQGLTNYVDGFTITNIEVAKSSRDAFYESLTVRIFAKGADYTVDEDGDVVSGSRTRTRAWSEYWTFIRSAAPASGTINCPNCAATVTLGATGICDFCGGKLTSGTFDWILSAIEQDEVYVG